MTQKSWYAVKQNNQPTNQPIQLFQFPFPISQEPFQA